MSPAAKPGMQRTISTPAQPQGLSSWRPDLPQDSPQDSAPSPSPPPDSHHASGFSQQAQGFDRQPLPCSSPLMHGIPARQPSYCSTGTEPVCTYPHAHNTCIATVYECHNLAFLMAAVAKYVDFELAEVCTLMHSCLFVCPMQRDIRSICKQVYECTLYSTTHVGKAIW